MRVIRTVVIALLFIAAVFLASANVQEVSLVFLPDLPVAGWPATRSLELPLFVLVLGSLVLGVLIGGFGALFEQARLRRGLRRADKEKKRLAAELAQAAEERERYRQERDEARAELEKTRAEQVTPEAPADAGADGGEEERPVASAVES
ncbi:MAG: DUF1049 domain-containing protein [Deltaproteobacteria bacterium]|nr:MAG: DUF1049 domain-containing protein [Deltaproteobacteria bacterium]